MKVYIVTEGTYDDYRICAVTTDVASAERLRKVYSRDWSEARIEVYETQSVIDEPKTYYTVELKPEGTVLSCEKRYFIPNTDTEPSTDFRLGFNYVSTNVITDDTFVAVQTAITRFAEYKARSEEISDKLDEMIAEIKAEQAEWGLMEEQLNFNNSTATVAGIDFTTVPVSLLDEYDKEKSF